MVTDILDFIDLAEIWLINYYSTSIFCFLIKELLETCFPVTTPITGLGVLRLTATRIAVGDFAKAAEIV